MLGTPLFVLEELLKKLKRKFVVPAIVLMVTFVLFRFVLFIGYVPTESMEPTLHKDTFIIGSRIWRELEAGDIVVFRHEGKLLVKRIAALEGNMVERQGNYLCVPTDSYYVLGDNTEKSWDSRYWVDPFVIESQICAKVIMK